MALKLLDKNLEMKEKQWYIKDILPKGELTLLAGESGIGKSSLTAYLASAMPQGSKTMFWLLEDDVQSYVNKIGVKDNIDFCDYRDNNNVPRIPTVEEIEQDIRDLGISLFVIDPIAFMMNGDINDNQKVRALLTPLQDIAKRTDCCILGVHHFSKGKGRVKDRATGAHAWVATPRHVLSFVKDSDERLFLEVTKSNIARTGTSWEADSEVDQYTMRITSLEDADEGSAQEALDSNYDDQSKDKTPGVIRNLKEQFDIGEKFTLDNIRECGNVKTFYNYIRRNPGAVQKGRDGRASWYIFI